MLRTLCRGNHPSLEKTVRPEASAGSRQGGSRLTAKNGFWSDPHAFLDTRPTLTLFLPNGPFAGLPRGLRRVVHPIGKRVSAMDGFSPIASIPATQSVRVPLSETVLTAARALRSRALLFLPRRPALFFCDFFFAPGFICVPSPHESPRWLSSSNDRLSTWYPPSPS